MDQNTAKIQIDQISETDRILLFFLSSGVFEAHDFSGHDLKDLTVQEWNKISNRSLYHGVAPQFYITLKDYWKSKIIIPSEIMQQLKNVFMINTALGLRRYYELVNVLQILNEHSISVIVLKGACLANLIYKKMGIRTMSDVDLMFKDKDLASAQALLAEKGYPAHSEKLNIDFHWTLDIPVHSLGISMQGVWDRAFCVEIEGVPTRILSPVDLILHLIMHVSYQHLFKHYGLRALYDIREVIEHFSDQIDWEEMKERASEWMIENSALLTFFLAKKLLNANIPEEYLKDFTDNENNQEVINWAMNSIFSKIVAVQGNVSPQFTVLWSQEPLWNKAGCLFRLLFPPSREITTTYPVVHGTFKNYFYYFIRLKNHASYYYKLCLKMLKGDEELSQRVKEQNKGLAVRRWLQGKA